MTTTGISWTQRLAEFVVEADPRAVSASVRTTAAETVADTMGCILAGLVTDVGAMTREYAGLAGESDGASLWGSGAVARDPERLALVGGAAGAALDYDDVSSNGHPSSIIVATILALAAQRPTSGQQALDAYLVGYEVAARLGDVVHLAHSRHGWHTTSTIGYFSAAATACRLLGLDVMATRNALGIAASMAAGIGRNFGTATKPLHSGLAARGGLTAAGLAAAGATSAADALEGPRGFFAVFGCGQENPGELERLGAPWVMEETVPSLKKYPACYVVHREVDAVLQLQEAHDLAAEDVERIEVRAPTKSAGTLAYTVPTTGLEAKFSAHYAAAAAFLDRRMTIASFSDEMALRPKARNLMSRIDVAEDPRCRPEDPDGRDSVPITGGFWEVTVYTVDGRRLQSVSTVPPGSPSRPLHWTEIREKFLDCASSSGYDTEVAGRVADDLRALDEVPELGRLLDRLTTRQNVLL